MSWNSICGPLWNVICYVDIVTVETVSIAQMTTKPASLFVYRFEARRQPAYRPDPAIARVRDPLSPLKLWPAKSEEERFARLKKMAKRMRKLCNARQKQAPKFDAAIRGTLAPISSTNPAE